MDTRNERVAFCIGEDLAYYGQPLPVDASPAMSRGREVALQRQTHHRPPNRFVRKWLQLRLGAWRRCRVFNSDVSPEFLERIDVPVCPVTLMKLTHGTGKTSDWSIDRLDNDAAYAQMNLAVLSTYVNSIKGAMSVEDILDQAASGTSAVGLEAREWGRLAYLVGCASLDQRHAPRPVFMPNRAGLHLAVPWSVRVLAALLRMTSQSAGNRKRFFEGLEQCLSRSGVTSWHLLAECLQRYASRTPEAERCVVQFSADDQYWAVYSRFWREFFGTPVFTDVVSLVTTLMQGRDGFASNRVVTFEQMRHEFGKATFGYG